MALAGASLFAAPARVWATTIAAVDFPAESITSDPVLFDAPAMGLCEGTGSAPAYADVTWPGATTSSGRCTIDAGDKLQFRYPSSGQLYDPDETTWPNATWTTGLGPFELFVPGVSQFNIRGWAANPIGCNCGNRGLDVVWRNSNDTIQSTVWAWQLGGYNAGTLSFFDVVVTVPDVSTIVGFALQGHNTTEFTALTVEQLDADGDSEGGSCVGTGTMTGGDVEHATIGVGTWGADWVSFEGEGYCKPMADDGIGVVTWEPGGVVLETGVVYCLESEWAANAYGQVTVYATNGSGGPAYLFASYPMRSSPAGAPDIGQDRTACNIATADAYGLQFVMPPGVWNGGQLLRDGTVEELLLYPPTGKSPGRVNKGLVDYFEDCEIPTAGDVPVLSDIWGFLFGGNGELANPIDYIPYGICLMVGGFRTVADFLVDVVNGIVDLGSDIAAFIGSIPGGAVDGLGDILEALFTPESIGEQWEELLDLLGTKVPTAWIGEAVGFLSSMVTAGNLAGGPIANLSTPWGAVSIDAPAASVTESFEDYRPIGSALLTLACAVAVLRQIRGALGSAA